MYNLYKSNNDDSSRFFLGKNGNKKLFIIGLNPSTATSERSDTTVAKVEKVAKNKGYDGFVMFNLYPLRSTNPDELPGTSDEKLLKSNIENILELARLEKEPSFWAAWGNNICIRSYLKESLLELYSEIQKINGRWLHYGDLTKKGHPRHPSRLCYEWEFNNFEIEDYIKKIPNN